MGTPIPADTPAARPLAFVLACCIAFSAGCDDGLGLIKVGGVVKFGGAECPSDGRIVFKPVDIAEGGRDRAGTAQFQKDGRFQVTSYSPDDGLFPGRYRVEITCLKGVPDFSDPKGYEKMSYVPADYQPEELVVEKGKDLRSLVYDVPLKK